MIVTACARVSTYVESFVENILRYDIMYSIVNRAYDFYLRKINISEILCILGVKPLANL